MPRYLDRDEYIDPATGVLRNLLGIREQALLDIAEANLVSARSQELSLFPIGGRFDLFHLKSIHRQLFRDVYKWAGELRTVDISKGNSRFAHHAYIETAAQPIFEQLKAEKYLAGLDEDSFCSRAAFYLSEINALHPFRDGNGRAQREFLQLLARKNGYIFHWRKVNRKEMLQASVESFKGDLVRLAAILHRILHDLPS